MKLCKGKKKRIPNSRYVSSVVVSLMMINPEAWDAYTKFSKTARRSLTRSVEALTHGHSN